MAEAPIRPGTATVVLDGSGNGTARIGPAGALETWHAEAAAVSASTNSAEAQCKVYVGDQVTAANYVDGTLSGSTGDSTGRVSARPLRLGDYIWAAWSGGDPGAVATLNVTGIRDV